MAAQFDFIAGLDISGLATVTKAQLLQMINQMAPLSNIGGIICQSTTPDVANNARFSRYVWLDTSTTPPTSKVYNSSAGTWGSLSVPDGSVTNAKIVDGTINLPSKGLAGTARYILRTNAAGTAVEWVNPNSIFATGDVPITALGTSGAPAGISYAKKDGAGTVAWALPLITDIDGSAASALQVVRRNAANNAQEFATVPFGIVGNSPIDSGNLLSVDLPAGATGIRNYAHGLGTTPKLVRVVLRNVTPESSYVAGDEIEISGVYDALVAAGDIRGRPVYTVSANATNVYVSTPNITAGDHTAYDRAGTGAFALTLANWRIRVYAYA